MSEAIVPFQFSELQNMAKAIAASGLFGMKTPEQALALMLVAQAEGLHPAVIARDYDIISGRPAKKSEAMMRSFLASDGSVQWHELTDTRAEATFIHPQGGTLKLDWTIEMAKRAGLYDKQNRDGSANMWHKYPRRMLSARLLAEGIRTVCPLATSGMYVPEEVVQMEDDGGEPVNINSRRRTGKGWTQAEKTVLPEKAETPLPIVETKPGVYETVKPVQDSPASSESSDGGVIKGALPKQDAGEWFKKLESAATLSALAELGKDLAQSGLSADDLDTARKLYKARHKDLSKPKEMEPWI